MYGIVFVFELLKYSDVMKLSRIQGISLTIHRLVSCLGTRVPEQNVILKVNVLSRKNLAIWYKRNFLVYRP